MHGSPQRERGSAIGHAVHLLGLASALHLDLRRCVLDIGEVLPGQFDVGGAEVFF